MHCTLQQQQTIVVPTHKVQPCSKGQGGAAISAVYGQTVKGYTGDALCSGTGHNLCPTMPVASRLQHGL